MQTYLVFRKGSFKSLKIFTDIGVQTRLSGHHTTIVLLQSFCNLYFHHYCTNKHSTVYVFAIQDSSDRPVIVACIWADRMYYAIGLPTSRHIWVQSLRCERHLFLKLFLLKKEGIELKRKRVFSVILILAFLLSFSAPVITVSNAAENLALNKPAAASSSYNATNTPNKAFDGNPNTRWESEYSDPQWIMVDLGSSYNIAGVKIVWENAAGKEYRIQVSQDSVSWTDVYTVTNGTMAHVLDASFQPVPGRYVRMYGTQRAMIYGYSIWEFEVYGSEGDGPPPVSINPPSGLTVTSYTANSISLGWNPVPGAAGYNIYRSFTAAGPYMKVNSAPVTSTGYTDTGLDTATYYYKVSAVSGSSESSLSDHVSARTILDFGPNVIIFDPSMPASYIQDTVNYIYDRMAPADTGQFSSERYALLFKPGNYSTFVNVGYYTQVLGLGLLPDQTSINGLACWPNLPNNNATCNFWRGVENIAVNSDTVWAVSQAVSMRRVHIRGELSLHWYGG